MTNPRPYGTRAEHLSWCKQLALAYVDTGDLTNALASMASDLHKHPETDNPVADMLLSLDGIRCVQDNDADGMRKLINGFN